MPGKQDRHAWSMAGREDGYCFRFNKLPAQARLKL